MANLAFQTPAPTALPLPSAPFLECQEIVPVLLARAPDMPVSPAQQFASVCSLFVNEQLKTIDALSPLVSVYTHTPLPWKTGLSCVVHWAQSEVLFIVLPEA